MSSNGLFGFASKVLGHGFRYFGNPGTEHKDRHQVSSRDWEVA